jgi:hypothetical protein
VRDPLLLYRTCVDGEAIYRSIPQDAEMMRLQMLGDPRLMAQLRQVRRLPVSTLPLLNASYSLLSLTQNWPKLLNPIQYDSPSCFG